MKLIVLLFIFFVSVPSFGLNYFRCEVSKDCTKAYGGCGTYISVHRRYKETYEAKAHVGDRVSNCLKPTAKDKEIKFKSQPECHKKRCLLILPKSEKVEEST